MAAQEYFFLYIKAACPCETGVGAISITPDFLDPPRPTDLPRGSLSVSSDVHLLRGGVGVGVGASTAAGADATAAIGCLWRNRPTVVIAGVAAITGTTTSFI